MTFDTPIPFAEAIAIARRRGILPNDLSSADLSRLEAQWRQRSTFSARMDKAGVLDVLQKMVEQIAGGDSIDEENGRLRSIPEAKAQLKEAMYRSGVAIAPVGTPKIKDFYSETRRSLMINTSVLDVMGFGQHVAGQDSALLFSAPAQELVRFRVPKGGTSAERDWPARWKAALDTLSEEDARGCTDEMGRMVALKNNPIWQALGDGEGGYSDTLGNPWAPFAFNSGMGLIDVARPDAVALGIIGADEEVKPDTSFDLNESLEASVAKFSAGLQRAVSGGGFFVHDGVLKPVRNRARRDASPEISRVRNRLGFVLAQLQEAQ